MHVLALAGALCSAAATIFIRQGSEPSSACSVCTWSRRWRTLTVAPLVVVRRELPEEPRPAGRQA